MYPGSVEPGFVTSRLTSEPGFVIPKASLEKTSDFAHTNSIIIWGLRVELRRHLIFLKRFINFSLGARVCFRWKGRPKLS